MIRSTPYLVLALATCLSGAAWAGVPCNQPGPCDPSVAPPPVDEAALQREARADAVLNETARHDSWDWVQRGREAAWRQRGIDDLPAAVAHHSPLFELAAHSLVRVWSGHGQYVQLGGDLALRLQILRMLTFELGSTLTTQRAPHDRFTVWTLEPTVGYVFSDYRNSVHGRAYGGPIFGGTRGDAGHAATTLYGGKLGMGGSWRVTELGDGGYFGVEGDAQGLVVGGTGAQNPSLGAPRLGFSLSFGLVVAL